MAITTRSPAAKPRTPAPTVSNRPENSCPMVMGGFMRGLPFWKVFRSEPHTAQASMRTRSSPAPQAGTGTSSTRTSFLP